MNKKKRAKHSPPPRPAACNCCEQGKGDSPSLAPPGSCRCDARALGGFGVTADLSSFFSDERRECWVWVAARRPVAWLRARLAVRMQLTCSPNCLALLAPQGLLHPEDPLALLSPGDIVRVVPVQTVLFDDDKQMCKRKKVECETCISSCDEPDSAESCESELLFQNGEEDDCASRNDMLICTEQPENPRVKSPVCVTRAVVASPDTRAATCSVRLEHSPLQAMKQRALQLLNRYEHSLDSEPSSSSRAASLARDRSPLVRAGSCAGADSVDGGAPDQAPRRRRRRVRRRPRVPASPPAPNTASTPEVCALSARAARASSVVQNAAAARPPAARRVHALGV